MNSEILVWESPNYDKYKLIVYRTFNPQLNPAIRKCVKKALQLCGQSALGKYPELIALKGIASVELKNETLRLGTLK
jgi:hypothetical protein